MAGEFESVPLPTFTGNESAVVIDGLDYVRSHGTSLSFLLCQMVRLANMSDIGAFGREGTLCSLKRC